METLNIKFNNGNLAILCSGCRKILKTGIDFTTEELNYCTGKSKKKLPAQYCEKCTIKKSE